MVTTEFECDSSFTVEANLPKHLGTLTYTRPYMQKHVQEARSLNQIQDRTPFESLSSRFAHSIYI